MDEFTMTFSFLNLTSESSSDDESQDYSDSTLNTDASYRIISFVIAWLVLSLCIFGIIGNIFSITIYCSPSMRSPINVLLAGLSFIDLMLSVLAVPTFVIPGLTAFYGTAILRTVTSLVAVYLYPWTVTLQTASVYAFVVITIERWQTVARRSKARLSTVERARGALIVVFVLSIAYNVVRFFEFRLVYNEEPVGNETDRSVAWGLQRDHGAEDKAVELMMVLRNSTMFPIYMNVYYVGMFLVTHFIVPFAILVVLNGLIVKAICRSRQRRMSLNRRERSEHRTASMIIIVVAIFIICYSLLFSLNVIEAIDADWFFGKNMALAFALNDISNLLVVANSASTIVVYYYFSGKYRFMLITLLLRIFPCFNANLLALRRPSTTGDDEMGFSRKLSASAGMHALFLVVARTAESKRSFLTRRSQGTIQRQTNGCSRTFNDCRV